MSMQLGGSRKETHCSGPIPTINLGERGVTAAEARADRETAKAERAISEFLVIRSSEAASWPLSVSISALSVSTCARKGRPPAPDRSGARS
jgi:hypothetical protein